MDDWLNNLKTQETRSQALGQILSLNEVAAFCAARDALFYEGLLLPAVYEVIQNREENTLTQWQEAVNLNLDGTFVRFLNHVSQNSIACCCPFCQGKNTEPHFVRVLRVSLAAARAALEMHSHPTGVDPKAQLMQRTKSILDAASLANQEAIPYGFDAGTRWVGDSPDSLLVEVKGACPSWSIAPVRDLIRYFLTGTWNDQDKRVRVTFPLDIGQGNGLLAKLALEKQDDGFGELYADVRMLVCLQYDEQFKVGMDEVWETTGSRWRERQGTKDVRWSLESYRNEGDPWKRFMVAGYSASAAFGIGLDYLLNDKNPPDNDKNPPDNDKNPPDIDWAITGGVGKKGNLTGVGGYQGKTMPFNKYPNLQLVIPEGDKNQIPKDWKERTHPTKNLTEAYDLMTGTVKAVSEYLSKLRNFCNTPPAYYPSDVQGIEKVRVRVAVCDRRVEIDESKACSLEQESLYRHRNWSAIAPPQERYEILDWDEKIRPKIRDGAIKRMVIVGDPGLGKTWLLKAEALYYTDQALAILQKEGDLEAIRLPIFLHLQDLANALHTVQQRRNTGSSEPVTVENAILEAFANESNQLLELIKRKLEAKQCILLLDSWDEVTQHGDPLLKNLREWVSNVGIPVAFTSRLVGYKRPWAIPDTKEDRETTGVWEMELLPFGDTEIEDFIDKFFSQDANAATELKTVLENASHFKGMASVPLLLGFICLIHGSNRSKPEGKRQNLTQMRRSDLYRQVLEKILRGEWRQNQLDDEQVNAKLRLFTHIALKLLEQEAEQFTYQQLEGVIQQSNLLEHGRTAAQEIEDLADTFSLLTKYGSGFDARYLFLHLTFQEYLAARALADQANSSGWEAIDALIKQKARDARWQVVILLLGEMLKNPTPLQNLIQETIEDKTSVPPVRVRIALAETLGEIGDHRFLFMEEDGHTVVNDCGRQRRIWRKQEKGLIVPATVFIPATVEPFLMGSTEEDIQQYKQQLGYEFVKVWVKDEQPAHIVMLSAYEIGRYPVTYREYEQFVEARGYTQEEFWTDGGWEWLQSERQEAPEGWDDARFHKPNYPVVGITWYEAMAYCNWLGAKLGRNCRLPTEAEWEYAARTMDRFLWAWGNEPPLTAENAWELCNAYLGSEQVDGTTPVGIYAKGATIAGIYDLAGNMWEWCWDRYDEAYYGKCKRSKIVKDPKGPEEGLGRVLRGGSWFNYDGYRFRAAIRLGYYADFRLNFLGFRCVFPPDS